MPAHEVVAVWQPPCPLHAFSPLHACFAGASALVAAVAGSVDDGVSEAGTAAGAGATGSAFCEVGVIGGAAAGCEEQAPANTPEIAAKSKGDGFMLGSFRAPSISRRCGWLGAESGTKR